MTPQWPETHWNQSVFSLPPELLLRPVFIYVYAQSLHLYTGLSWGSFPQPSIWGRVGYSLPEIVYGKWLDETWDLMRLPSFPLPREVVRTAQTYLECERDGWWQGHADLGGRRKAELLKSWRNTCGLWKIIFHSAVSALHHTTWCAFSYCVFTRPDLFRLVWSFQA